MAIDSGLGSAKELFFLFEFSYDRSVMGLSGADPTHVLCCNSITLKENIPTFKFQGDIIQIIAVAICMHFGITTVSIFLWA